MTMFDVDVNVDVDDEMSRIPYLERKSFPNLYLGVVFGEKLAI